MTDLVPVDEPPQIAAARALGCRIIAGAFCGCAGRPHTASIFAGDGKDSSYPIDPRLPVIVERQRIVAIVEEAFENGVTYNIVHRECAGGVDVVDEDALRRLILDRVEGA